ncbi:hypothetical protein [Flavobacterium ajazii]|nr:hypothetical protein [Flavobacterium ajazii]
MIFEIIQIITEKVNKSYHVFFENWRAGTDLPANKKRFGKRPT